MPASEPGRRRAFHYFIAGLIHAAAMLLAFPPLDLWGMAFVAPIPLIWAGWRRGADLVEFGRRVKLGRAFWMVALGIMPVQAYEHQWVMDVSVLGYPGFVICMSLLMALIPWGLSVVMARWPGLPLVLTAPLVWTGMEFLRGEVVGSGYPWLLIAHPLVAAPVIPLTASLLGTYFTGFLVVAAAGVVVGFVVRRPKALWATGGVAFVAGATLAGSLLAVGPGPESMRIGVVQTNIPQSNKMEWEFKDRFRDFGIFTDLTRQAAAKADVVVWPETMFPGLTLSASGIAEERAAGLTFEVPPSVDPRRVIPTIEFHDRLLQLSTEVNRPMLVGALALDGLKIGSDSKGVTIDYAKRYNSVFLVEGGKVDPTPYSKLELTPFGEVMPGIQRWPWLQKQFLALGASGMTFDLSPGPGPRVFDVRSDHGAAIVTPICFEATKPGLCRRLVRAAGDRPVVMVNLTNDGWFGEFRPGRLQHLQIARWRCIELGVPMVRAANTGISAAIDHRGRVTASGIDGHPGAWKQDGVLTATVNPARARTLYARIGDVFGWSMLGGMLLAVGFSLVTGGSARKESEA